MRSTAHNWKNFIKTGNDASFSAIYNNVVDDLFAYGMSLGFQRDSCKDAIQDVFIKIYLSRKGLSNIDNITPYIFRSFKNRLIDFARKEKNIYAIDYIGENFALEVTILDDIIDNETADIIKHKVAKLLNNITPNQREAVYLKYVTGLQHKEIADILNINEESARKLLYRAMEKLRKLASDEELPERTALLAVIHLFCMML
jgi:RNA polymerase sigma factor (sigma-70 family)